MKKYIIVLIVLIFISCATKKETTNEVTKTETKIDSLSSKLEQNKEITIEWYLPGNENLKNLTQSKTDSSNNQGPSNPKWNWPSYGKVKITTKIDEKTEKVSSQKKIKQKQKKKKSRKGHIKMLKSDGTKNGLIFVSVIIILIIVKIAARYKNNIKNLLKIKK
ncbi:MAG: hypothetical protein [Bacteriophage sp.]|nr:MAG: hypothetical protein [Bacteriophage sp.]